MDWGIIVFECRFKMSSVAGAKNPFMISGFAGSMSLIMRELAAVAFIGFLPSMSGPPLISLLFTSSPSDLLWWIGEASSSPSASEAGS